MVQADAFAGGQCVCGVQGAGAGEVAGLVPVAGAGASDEEHQGVGGQAAPDLGAAGRGEDDLGRQGRVQRDRACGGLAVHLLPLPATTL